jgi:hypothetical protein
MPVSILLRKISEWDQKLLPHVPPKIPIITERRMLKGFESLFKASRFIEMPICCVKAMLTEGNCIRLNKSMFAKTKKNDIKPKIRPVKISAENTFRNTSP